MSEVKCNVCDNVAETKLSKAGKVYYSCGTCPSDNPAYKGMFLTLHEKLDVYNKQPKKGSPRQDCNPCDKAKEIKESLKRKYSSDEVAAIGAKKSRKEAADKLESEKLRLLSNEIESQSKKIAEQITKTDLLLERIERLLDSSSKPQSEDESDDTTE